MFTNGIRIVGCLIGFAFSMAMAATYLEELKK